MGFLAGQLNVPDDFDRMGKDEISRLFDALAALKTGELTGSLKNIERGLGRDDLPVAPRALRRGLLDNGYDELSITSGHGLVVADLPPLHKDPFDRMLLAQANIEGMRC